MSEIHTNGLSFVVPPSSPPPHTSCQVQASYTHQGGLSGGPGCFQGKLNGADMHRLWAVDCSAAETKKAIEALVTLRISIVCGTWELIKMHSPHS